ncbi:hypothetical protein [Streptomyces sp. SD15]
MVEHLAQFLGIDVGAERLGARFEPYSCGKWPCNDGVEAEVVDEVRDEDRVRSALRMAAVTYIGWFLPCGLRRERGDTGSC